MIPFVYRLREEVHIEREEGSSVVVTETPLSIIRVSHRAARILQLCDGHRTPVEIALQIGQTEETEVYRICDFLNKRGVLEVGPVRGEGPTPFVTVIIPTKDRRNELAECLKSVFSQEYPGDLEVIVVDDGSTDGTDKLLNDLPCKVLSNSRTRGQSHCRNKGAEVAQGEILAFLDSDCVASPTWLKELAPSFQWNEVGAVGGYVDGYFEESSLDRYEKAFSPLNMGARILSAANDTSTLYAPTCNLLVRKEVYKEVGGIREEMSVGEDVDLCWRLRTGGHRLLYVPYGTVKHKHRSVLRDMLRRRTQYGTSEALLYSLHGKRKTLQAPPLAAIAFFALAAAIVCLSVIPVFLAAACFLTDCITKVRKIGRMGVPVRPRRILFSVVRTHSSFFYFASFHVVRYYTIALLLLALLFHPLWLLCLSLLLTTSIVDYRLKKPRLSFAVFFFYYVLEQVAYQAGVFAGCLRQRTFSSYGVKLVRRLP